MNKLKSTIMNNKSVLQKNVLFVSVFMFLFAFLSVGLSSCDKTDDPVIEDPVDLVVSPTSLTLGLDETETITITDGNGGYEVSVADKSVATATISSNKVTVTGKKEGSTSVIIKDKAKKSQTVSVTVKGKAVSGSNNIDTSVKYDMKVLSGEKGAGNGWTLTTNDVRRTTILTKRDFKNNVNTEDINGEALSTLDEFFNGFYNGSDDAFICGGYYDNGGLDMGYAAPALLLTDKDDSANPGCKVIDVITSNLGAYNQWAGYSSKANSTAFYDPSDGSFTIKVSGYLGWGFDFTYNRKYTPAK